jgi:heptosyltransferase-2
MSELSKLATPDPASILVRGVNWLGDAVMTTPALQRLRERFPQAKITLLTPQKFSDLWLHHPSIDEVITFKPRESFLRIASRIRGWKFMKTAAEFQKGRLSGKRRNLDEAVVRAMQFYALLGDFSRVPFDLALVFPNSPRSALEVWLARVPRRIGYARPWRNWLLTDPVPTRPGHFQMRKRSKKEIAALINEAPLPTPQATPGTLGVLPAFINQASIVNHQPSIRHQIHEYLHLVSILGANPEPLPPRLEVTPAEIQTAESSLLSLAQTASIPIGQFAPPLWLAFNPSAAYGPAKRWPVERFATVILQVCERFPKAVWIAVGGPEDSQVCNDVIRLARSPVFNCAGRTSLRELMAMLKLSRVLLTNDSGPMHVAAALGTPVVVPFGSTSPELTAPGLPGDARHQILRADVPCSPCFRRECPIDFRCMTGISVETVLEAVLQAVR